MVVVKADKEGDKLLFDFPPPEPPKLEQKKAPALLPG